MKNDVIHTFVNRFSASQRETMIRLNKMWIDSKLTRFKNLWIVS